MKKFIAIICLMFTLTSLFVSASDTTELDLPCIPSDFTVNIDGKNSEAVWEKAAKITLTKDNTGTWAGMDSQEDILPLDAFFMWSNDGIYVFADIKDNNPVFDGVHDCFEVAFNPGGIIPKEDELQGMFFMFWPFDEDSVKCTRHNMSKETQAGVEAHDVQAKYKETDGGWTMEALIPWYYICDETRPVYVNRRKTETLLKNFEHNEGAFLTATVCRLNGDEENQYLAVYRTCTDNNGSNFNTDSYNIKMTLGKEIAIPETNTQAQTHAPITDSVQSTSKGSNSTAVIAISAVAAVVVIAAVAGVILKKRNK